MPAEDRLVAIDGAVKSVSQAAVLTPSGWSGPDSVALDAPWLGPAQVSEGTGLAVPLYVPWKPHVVLAPGARLALYAPSGVAVTAVPVWVTVALYGDPAMTRWPAVKLQDTVQVEMAYGELLVTV